MLFNKFCEWWMGVCDGRMVLYFLGCFLYGFTFGIVLTIAAFGIAALIDKIFGTSLLDKMIGC